MICKNCGFDITGGESFCPNCGAATAGAPSQPTGNPIPSPIPSPIPTPASADPGAGATIALPPQDAPGFGGPVPPVTPMEPPKKKKKKTLLIVLLILIPVLLIIAAIVTIFLIGKNLYDHTEKGLNAYWTAYVEEDGQAMADQVPDSYWDYIADTYDFTEEECVAGMNYYLNQYADGLGGDLSYTMKTNGFQYNTGSSVKGEGAKDVQSRMKDWGISYSAAMGSNVDTEIKGAEDTDDFSDTNMWMVKVDGKWCSVNSMVDFETICEEGYAQNAKYEEAFGDQVESFWNAFYQQDMDTIFSLMPDELWPMLEQEFDCDQKTAENYTKQYIEEMLRQSTEENLDDIQISMQITEVTDAEEDEISNANEFLSDYDMTVTDLKNVSLDYTANYGGNEETDTMSCTVIELNDTWYVYDAMYVVMEACYEYGMSY